MDNWKPRYWSIFLGQALSQIGSAVTQFVLLWWITITIGSVSSLATAGIFALLPQALLGPLGGVFADRYSRRWIMIITDIISALCMLILITLFSTNQIELWHVYSMLFIRSSMQAFQGPASQSSTSMLVPEHFLPRAAGLNQSILSLMTIAAAPIGALAMSVMPINGALMIDVVTAILGITPLFFYKIPQPKRVAESLGAWSEFKEGCAVVWNAKGIRHLFILQSVVVMVIMPCFTLVPLLVTTHFHETVQGVALMEGVAGGAMLFGSVLVAYLNPRKRVMTFLLGLSLSCGAVALTALAPPGYFYLAILCWGLSGISYTFGNAPLTVILQTTIPNKLQGRTFSLLGTMIGLSSPLGLALMGPVGDYIGVRNVFLVTGGLACLICLSGFLSPHLLKLEDRKGQEE